nr:ABC transporter substrate-binding protein [Govania unica]
MTAALSGPVSYLGRSMRAGIESYFAEVNATGGIHGRRLKLVVRDDAYDPPTAAHNILSLIEQDQVLGIIGSVGTPTAVKTIPIARAHDILFFAAMSGASILRPVDGDPVIVNFRASYAEETDAMLDVILARGIRPEEIAFFTQNDSYGNDGYAGALRALETRGFQHGASLPRGRYERGTLDVENALITLLDAHRPIKAVIMVGAYAPNAKFIRLARQVFTKAIFLNLSFVGSAALKDALKNTGQGVIVTEVVPPVTSNLRAVTSYRAAMSRYGGGVTTGVISLEGYLAARVLVAGLRAAGPRPSRKDLITAMHRLGSFDIGLDEPLILDARDLQASHRVWPMVIHNGAFEPLITAIKP